MMKITERNYDKGRFTSTDPLLERIANPELVSGEKYYGWSPYHYCRNEPVRKRDGNGKWDVYVHCSEGRNQTGIAVLTDKNGIPKATFTSSGK